MTHVFFSFCQMDPKAGSPTLKSLAVGRAGGGLTEFGHVASCCPAICDCSNGKPQRGAVMDCKIKNK